MFSVMAKGGGVVLSWKYKVSHSWISVGDCLHKNLVELNSVGLQLMVHFTVCSL